MKKNALSSIFMIAIFLGMVFMGPQVFAESRKDNSTSSIQNRERNELQINGDEHRSTVSELVKKLLEVADKEKEGIGEEVRVIAKEQDESKDNIATSVEKIKNRSAFKTFLIGTDYKNIGELRSESVKIENQIKQLGDLLSKAKILINKETIQAQVKVLEAQKQKIDDFLKANESKFSLFGWLVKMFNR